MRSLMDDDQIHPDVVSRLWQVYSEPTSFYQNSSRLTRMIGTDLSIPKQQRRGAIIILGMLALARRSVVQDKVDVLLQIGLGSLGKV
jgi:condensin complex subunit 1